jgi:HEAT repeat protein
MSVEDQDDLQLLLRRAAACADYEADDRWDIVRDLHRRTDRPTFDAVCALGRLDGIGERVLSLDILGQIGVPANRPFLGDTLPLVIGACDDNRPAVLVSAITALGHLADPRGLPAVCRHVAHPAAEVRFAVAAALPGIAGDPPSSQAVEALIRLSADPDADTRDWATFGLGSQLDEDTEPIREALAGRLEDEDGDTAGEALLGLARRADPRALPALLSRLGDAPGNLIVEAAAELGAPEALPALERLQREGWQQDEPRPSVLDNAIRACARGGPNPSPCEPQNPVCR